MTPPNARSERERLEWPTGRFYIHDPDPADDHGPIYLVFPDGLMVNCSNHAAPGMDAARLEWMASTLNTALDTALPAPPVSVEDVARAVFDKLLFAEPLGLDVDGLSQSIALFASRSAPEGFVTVPAEPTLAMTDASYNRERRDFGPLARGLKHSVIYKTMLAAAPKPEGA